LVSILIITSKGLKTFKKGREEEALKSRLKKKVGKRGRKFLGYIVR
jgi:hypothetical protein